MSPNRERRGDDRGPKRTFAKRQGERSERPFGNRGGPKRDFRKAGEKPEARYGAEKPKSTFRGDDRPRRPGFGRRDERPAGGFKRTGERPGGKFRSGFRDRKDEGPRANRSGDFSRTPKREFDRDRPAPRREFRNRDDDKRESSRDRPSQAGRFYRDKPARPFDRERSGPRKFGERPDRPGRKTFEERADRPERKSFEKRTEKPKTAIRKAPRNTDKSSFEVPPFALGMDHDVELRPDSPFLKKRERISAGGQHRPRNEPRITVTYEEVRSRRTTTVWVYDNMIGSTAGDLVDGQTVYVYDQKSKLLGSAIYNSNSRIRARIFSPKHEAYDNAYIERALQEAISRRRPYFPAEDSYRVAFSDADFLPGIVADKIGTVVVAEILTMAADHLQDDLPALLMGATGAKGVVLRLDNFVREKEGLALEEPKASGDVPELLSVQLDGYTLFCNPAGGQKTGLYLDQRLNRRLIAPYCADARVADLFCFNGGWSFAAAKFGAREVVGVDSSEEALDLARRGIEANATPQVRFQKADAFDFANDGAGKGEQYDIVICDPPAFAKTQKQVEDALRAYLSLNYRAMKLVKPGGIFVTCSCSQAVRDDQFEETLESAARNARGQFQILVRGSQPPDHPVLLGFPESRYLKCLVMQRVR